MAKDDDDNYLGVRPPHDGWNDDLLDKKPRLRFNMDTEDDDLDDIDLDDRIDDPARFDDLGYSDLPNNTDNDNDDLEDILTEDVLMYIDIILETTLIEEDEEDASLILHVLNVKGCE